MTSMIARMGAGSLLAATLLLGIGCGETTVVTNVDVVSFLEPSEANPTYGDVPPIPPGLSTIAVQAGPSPIQVPDGLGDIAEVTEADVSVRTIVMNQTGSGALELRMFFARPGEDPFLLSPSAVFTAQLLPGTATTIEQTVELTEEAQVLFQDAEIEFAYQIFVDGTGSSELVTGSVLIEKCMVRVVHDPDI